MANCITAPPESQDSSGEPVREIPNYYAVIPSEIMYNDGLEANAKLLFGQISGLSNKFGYCKASNQYFCELNKWSERTVSRLIKSLEDRGYISRDVIKDKSGQVSERRIYILPSVTCGHPVDKIVTTPCQNCQDPPDKIVRYNSIDINNKKESKKKKDDKPDPLSMEEMKPVFEQCIRAIAGDDWSRETKNRLYLELIDFYQPREKGKTDPARTEYGIRRQISMLVKYSGGDPEVMIDLLVRSTAIGSRGIIDPNKSWGGGRRKEAEPAEPDGVLHL